MSGRHCMIRTWSVVVALVLATLLPPATQADVSTREVKDLSPVRVEAPATNLPIWYATKAGRTVLLLGTVSDVPADLEWRSEAFDQLLAGVGAIVMPPSATLKLGFFGRLAAVTSARGKSNYPAGKTLADALSKSAYLDVILANQKFNHGDPALLHFQPGFAAFVLDKAVLRALHFDHESPVYDYLRKLGRRNDARILEPAFSVRLDHPRDYIKEISYARPVDVACLSSLASLLAHRPDQLRVRAQAWADGDITGIRAADIPAFDICRASMLPKQLLARHGVTDLPEHMRAVWVAAIADASRDHRLTVAALPVRLLAGSGGYLSALRLEGFTIVGPKFDASSYSGQTQPQILDKSVH